MANTRVVLAKGFSVGVVVMLGLIGSYVLLALGGFSQGGLLYYLLTFSFALTATRGIWTGRYKVATIGAVGMFVVSAIQGAAGALALGLSVLLLVALVVGYSGRTREHLSDG
ncbi:hypothetical protein M0R88_08145 [Halorussus gelatinilyticus]|uniref:Uncharacterized protein n=1 Tax=Halorussus gelatinilyticus TaxID=2937524 RepID=A0A8U0INL8_9EURY|nr:hypothetical protein [Halorussus gelatinilyticus]UPW02052.1 hypothetical protein M0R88_08145 [Halorussus gelatinilyticus]